MTAVDKLIATAEAEIGYLEKKSNASLDDKTANAGSNNYTKYNRDLKSWTGAGYIAAQWCQAFIDWVFIKAFGLATAKLLIYVWTNYTPTGSDAFKARNRYIKRGKGRPKRGDIVYFYSSAKGRIGHVGIVYKVTGSMVYTIEGNTSGANSLVTNGGGVKKKSYSLSSTYIDGYGSVDYSQVRDDGLTVPYGLQYSDVGDDVKAMQKLLLKWDPNCLPAYGADGDFGSETLAAVKAFQKSAGLPVTGIYDDATEDALNALFSSHIEITGNAVNVRSEPNATTARILGVVKKGARLVYRGQKSDTGWLAVTYMGQNGWVSPKYGKLVA